jgi:membrane dipeptidase
MTRPTAELGGRAAALTRRTLVQTALGGVALAGLPWPRAFSATAHTWPPYSRAIVIDGLGSPAGSADASDDGAPLQAATLDAVRASGITAIHVTILPVGTTPPDVAFTQAVEGIAYWETQIDRTPDVFARIRTADDIVAAKRAGRTGLVYVFQDAVMFETDLARLNTFHQLGVRVIQLTYNRRNLLGDGCMEPSNAGLSLNGVAAVERLNELGILVDLSHCGRRTAADALRATKKPVAFTHTGSDALTPHPRHRTDEELRAVARSGGVAGIYVMPYLAEGRQPTAADVIRHLDHMVNVAGEDHVSIGTDGGVPAEVVDDTYRENFAAITRARREAGIAAPGETESGYLFAADLNSPRRFETLATMLSARGYSDARIEKILGANLLRVYRDTWTAPT